MARVAEGLSRVLAPERWWRLVRGPAALYLLTQVLGRVGGLIVLPLYARRLSIEEMGHFALAQTVVVALGPALTLGLGNAVVRLFFDGASRDEGARLAGGLFRWLTLQVSALVGASLLLCALVRPQVGFADPSFFVAVLLGAAGSSLMAGCLSYYRAAQRLRMVMALNIVELVQTTLLPLLFVQVLRGGYQGALAALSWGGGLTFVLATAIGWLAFRGRPTRKLIVEGLRFGWPLLVQFYGTWVTAHADRWFLQVHGFTAAVGRYSVGRQLSSPLQMIVSAVSDAEYPRVGERYRAEGLPGIAAAMPALRRLFLLVSLVPVVALVLALPALHRLVGGEAARGVWLAPVLALSVIVEAQGHPFVWVLFFARRMRVLKGIAIWTFAITVAGGVTLVPAFGVPGALATQAVASVLRVLLLRRAARAVLREAQPIAGEPAPPPVA